MIICAAQLTRLHFALAKRKTITWIDRGNMHSMNTPHWSTRHKLLALYTKKSEFKQLIINLFFLLASCSFEKSDRPGTDE